MLFTVALLCFLVRKARGELRKAMEQSPNDKALSSNGCAVVAGV